MALETAILNLPFASGLDQAIDERLLPAGKWARLDNLVCNKSGALEKRYGFAEVLPTADGFPIERPAQMGDFYSAPWCIDDPTTGSPLPRIYQHDGKFFRGRGRACPAMITAKNEIHRSSQSTWYASLHRAETAVGPYLVSVWVGARGSTPASGDFITYKIFDAVTGLTSTSEKTILGSSFTPLATCIVGEEVIVAQRVGTTIVVYGILASNGTSRTITTITGAGSHPDPFDVCPYPYNNSVAVPKFVVGFWDGASLTRVQIRDVSTGTVTGGGFVATPAKSDLSLCRHMISGTQGVIYAVTSQGGTGVVVHRFADGLGTVGANTVFAPASMAASSVIDLTATIDAGGDLFIALYNGAIEGTWVTSAGTELTKRVFLPRARLASRPTLYKERLWGTVTATALTAPSPDGETGALVCWDDDPGTPSARRPPTLCGVFGRYQSTTTFHKALPSIPFNATVSELDVIAPIVTGAGLSGRLALDMYRVSTDAYAPGVRPSSPTNGCLSFGGSFAGWYDGISYVEHGFINEPSITLITQNPGGGAIAAGTYQYVACFEWRDERGNLHRSMPSPAVQVVVSAGSTVTTIELRTTGLTRRLGSGAREIRIHVFRTKAGPGPDFYRITTDFTAPINDPTTQIVTLQDSISDIGLDALGYGFLYSTSEVPARLPPPARAVLTHKGRAWIASAEDERSIFYSKPLVNGLAPEFADEFSIYLSQANTRVTALAPLDDLIIAFTETQIFGIGGEGRNAAGGGSDYQVFVISSDAGCINANSIAVTSAGVFFQSQEGICLLGRDQSIRYVGGPIEDLLSNPTSSAGTRTVRSVVVDQQRRRVLWLALPPDRGSGGSILCHDLERDLWTSWSMPGVTLISQAMSAGIHWVVTTGGGERFGVEIRPSSPGSDQASARDYGAYVSSVIETPWIAVSGLTGFERTRRFGLQIRKRLETLLADDLKDKFLLKVEVFVDFDNTTVTQTLTWTIDLATTILDPANARLIGQIATQKHTAIRLRITDLPIGGDSTSLGRGPSFGGLSLEIAGKRGLAKVAAGNKG